MVWGEIDNPDRSKPYRQYKTSIIRRGGIDTWLDDIAAELDDLRTENATLREQIEIQNGVDMSFLDDTIAENAQLTQQLELNKGVYEMLQEDKDEANQLTATLYREVADLKQQLERCREVSKNRWEFMKKRIPTLRREKEVLQSQLTTTQSEVERLRAVMRSVATQIEEVYGGYHVSEPLHKALSQGKEEHGKD